MSGGSSLSGGGGGGGAPATTTYDIGTVSSSTCTVDWANGQKQTVVLGAPSVVFSFINGEPEEKYSILIAQDSTGGRVPGFSGVSFASHTIPSFSSAPYREDLVELETYDSSTFHGKVTVNYRNEGASITSGAPNTFSNLKLWLKSTVGVTDDGTGKCSLWADQSGNGYNFDSVNSGLRPTITASAQNGKTGLLFDGTGLGDSNGKCLKTTNVQLLSASNPFTALFVVKPTSSTAGDYVLWAFGSTNNGGPAHPYIFLKNSSGVTPRLWMSSDATHASSFYFPFATDFGTAHAFMIEYAGGSAMTTNANWTTRRGGGAAITPTYLAGGNGDNGSGLNHFGTYYHYAAGYGWGGYIFETAFWWRVFNDTERDKVFKYVKDEWAVTT